VTPRAQAIQMALATRCLGGRMIAIPLIDRPPQGDESPSPKLVSVPPGAILRREKYFVPGDNALLCVTSVTEVCVFDRVRFRNPRRVSVETIVLSLASHGISRHHHEVDLEEATFAGVNGTLAPADDVIKEFDSNVLQKREGRRAKKRGAGQHSDDQAVITVVKKQDKPKGLPATLDLPGLKSPKESESN
jgi:hypothetical protein